MKKKKNETDEECSARYLANHYRWLEKSGNKEKRNLTDKKSRADRFRRWQQAHPEKVRLKSATERATRLQRIPPWADLKVIEEFYNACPKGYHVDHVIPLRGKTVSGLHVITNLQYLTDIENLKKSNKFE